VAILKYYAETESGVYRQIKDALDWQYEQTGKTWTNKTSAKMRDRAVSILEKRYQSKIKEMLDAYIAENFPRYSQEFTVRVKYEIITGIIIYVESEAWNEQLTDYAWEELNTHLFAFIHNNTTWIEGSQDWKRWQRDMMQEEIKRIREENA